MLSISEYRSAVRHPLAWFDQRTRCPHCRRSLCGWLYQPLIAGPSPIVVATGRCPKCGSRVLARPVDPPGDEWPPLPTREEYRTADKRYQGRGLLVIGLGVLGGITGCYLGGVAGTLDLTGLPHEARVVLSVFAMLAPPVISVVLLWLMSVRARWDGSLSCGWCGALLAGQAETVLVSGRCAMCGRPALDDLPPNLLPGLAGTVLTRGDVAARHAARKRATNRGALFALTATAVGLVVAWMPLTVFGDMAGFEFWLAPRIGERRARVVCEFGPAVVIVLFAFVGIATALLWDWRARWRNPLDCPSCRKTFDQALAVAAGRCNQCFRPVIVDDSHLTPDSTGVAREKPAG